MYLFIYLFKMKNLNKRWL